MLSPLTRNKRKYISYLLSEFTAPSLKKEQKFRIHVKLIETLFNIGDEIWRRAQKNETKGSKMPSYNLLKLLLLKRSAVKNEKYSRCRCKV